MDPSAHCGSAVHKKILAKRKYLITDWETFETLETAGFHIFLCKSWKWEEESCFILDKITNELGWSCSSLIKEHCLDGQI